MADRGIETITTKDIGIMLDGYKGNTSEHLDFFYLSIFLVEGETEMLGKGLGKIEHFLSGKGWKRVKAQESTSAMYFGKYEKKTEETERDREKRLNHEIRRELYDTLESKYGTSFSNSLRIIITRACKYNDEVEFMTCQDGSG